jgi:hypothetical protein
MSPRPARHSSLRLVAAIALVALVLAGLRIGTAKPGAQRTSLVADSSAAAVPPMRGPLVKATLSTTSGGIRLPQSYVGLSTESWDVPGLDVDPAGLQRVLTLLRVPGDGPLSMRIGGQSTEQTYWDHPELGPGASNYHPGADWLTTLAALTRANHLKLLLDLNLVANSPAMAGSFAQAATAALPARSIGAFEVGNEPDIGHHMVSNPLAPPGTQVPWTPTGWDRYTEAAYLTRFRAYDQALVQAVPNVPVSGPDAYFPVRGLDWMRWLGSRRQPDHIVMLTVHRYALASCTKSTDHDYASIPHLLAQYTTGGLAHSAVGAVAVARQVHLPLRVSEFNSVTCGGSHGVSDSFATALWAADALFSIWSAGLSGVNFHIQLNAPNAPFTLSENSITARPLLYGMLMFERALGPGARLLKLNLVGASKNNVKVWAVRTQPHSLKVLAINKGKSPVRLALAMPSRGPASVQRLTAPSVSAMTGETLAGQTIGPDGRWVGPRVSQRVSRSRAGTYTVAVPGYSEALITTNR